MPKVHKVPRGGDAYSMQSEALYYVVMTLATHGIVGAAAIALVPTNPVLGFALAFASHLAIDSLPHRDYELLSKVEGERKLDMDMKLGRLFVYDLLRTGTDAFIGLVIALAIFSVWLFHVPFYIVVLGVVGGVLPDFLQLVFFKTRSRLLLPLQRFHSWLQVGKDQTQWPIWLGLFLQAILITILISIEKFFGLVG